MKRPLDHNWLPDNVSVRTEMIEGNHAGMLINIILFGKAYLVYQRCLEERCTCLRDDEPSRVDEPYEQCAHCGERTGSVHRRRMNTSYSDEEQNFTVECDSCFEQTEEFWAAMWADYYSGLL